MELNAKIFLETDGSYMLLVEEGKGSEAYVEVTEAELKQMAAAYAESSKKKKERGEKAVEEVKMIGKKAKVKAFLTKLIAAKKAKKAEAKKPKGAPDVEAWLIGLVKVHMVEEGMATDSTVDKKFQEVSDKGDYSELEEEAIMARGGHDDVVTMMVKNFKKKGYTVAQIKKGMREAGEQYTMFDEYLGK